MMRLVALLLGFALLTGCASDPNSGYAFGSAFDEGVGSVSVPQFENLTFTTGIEADLTDALVKRIQGHTPWRVATQGAADTVLTGVVTDVRYTELSRKPGLGFVQEQGFQMTVDFTWTDARTGEALVERRNFSTASTFIASRSTEGDPGERPTVGQREAIDEMAEAIVAQLRSRW